MKVAGAILKKVLNKESTVHEDMNNFYLNNKTGRTAQIIKRDDTRIVQ